MSFADDTARMLEALTRTPGWDRAKGALDDETVAAILSEAARFAETVIAPLNAIGDREGVRLEDGQVHVPDAYRRAYADMADGGWIALEQAEEMGGQGLPIAVFAAVNQAFERASPAFMMAAGGTRAAALLLTEWADPATRDAWVPDLIAGKACATICISEPEAGSDVGRIRTRATTTGQGWQVTGQKIWISFGDHDIGPRIGHCLLARTNDQPGTRGLSLFLVPKGDAVTTERVEDKLGLHGSPTCALRFDAAPAILIGQEGRGLSQLFTMIRHMRLMVACQGLGTAQACYDAARSHAEDRRQGGHPSGPPRPIIEHADVRRQLREMRRDVDLFRMALVQTAVSADLSRDDPEMARLCAFLLPLVKNFGAELGFDTAARAILVLGGGGYTKDYPVEQALRDARVFAIYEGTTGMQAQDFLLRQCLADDGAAVRLFVERAMSECDAVPAARAVVAAFDRFHCGEVQPASRTVQTAMAEPVMRAAWVAVQAWMSVRIAGSVAADSFLATAIQGLELHIARARFEADQAGTDPA